MNALEPVVNLVGNHVVYYGLMLATVIAGFAAACEPTAKAKEAFSTYRRKSSGITMFVFLVLLGASHGCRTSDYYTPASVIVTYVLCGVLYTLKQVFTTIHIVNGMRNEVCNIVHLCSSTDRMSEAQRRVRELGPIDLLVPGNTWRIAVSWSSLPIAGWLLGWLPSVIHFLPSSIINAVKFITRKVGHVLNRFINVSGPVMDGKCLSPDVKKPE